MPHSLSRVLIHLIFSTKNRIRIIAPSIQPELHRYLGGTLIMKGCPFKTSTDDFLENIGSSLTNGTFGIDARVRPFRP